MIRYLGLNSLAILFTLCPAVASSRYAPVIPNASYVIYEGSGRIIGISRPSKYATFYTYDGTPLETVEHNFSFNLIESRLDPLALKPQPITYKIQYWRGYLKGKGVPGHFIVFYDKHGNKITSYRYDKDTQEVTIHSILKNKPGITVKRADLKNLTDFPLDLSIVKEN